MVEEKAKRVLQTEVDRQIEELKKQQGKKQKKQKDEVTGKEY